MDEKAVQGMIDSTTDDRTQNNATRHHYRVLTEDEKLWMQALKDAGQDLINLTYKVHSDVARNSREFEYGIKAAEEAVMWAVKGLTA